MSAASRIGGTPWQSNGISVAGMQRRRSGAAAHRRRWRQHLRASLSTPHRLRLCNTVTYHHRS